jgi:putative ABC transport system permease protein
MPPLAMRNLFHDKVRLGVTLAGVTFAVVLMAVQLGLFIGFIRSATDLITHSDADFWLVRKGVPYLEEGAPFAERKLSQVRATSGVAQAEKYIASTTAWKQRNGRGAFVMVVGFDIDSGLGGPWNVVQGKIEDLRMDRTVIVDDLYFEKLGVQHVGDSMEMFGRRAHVVGATHGIRAFTTMPYVFTSYRNALDYCAYQEDETTYILVKAQPGADLEDLRRRLSERLSEVDVLTRDEFANMTSNYWIFTTGAGMAIMLAAVLGLLVGLVVVAQTIYSSTMDHLREFGTLKAMGATNGYIYRIIIKQATISAVIGYALGMSIGLLIVWKSDTFGASILIPWPLGVAMFFITVIMCMGAAVVSINKVTKIDPVMVFRQ